ncbi:MAG: hypothetical protein ACI9WS_002709, partial [Paraglaciecola psychrophila]
EPLREISSNEKSPAIVESFILSTLGPARRNLSYGDARDPSNWPTELP